MRKDEQDKRLTRKITETFHNFANVLKHWKWVSNTETKNKSHAIDSIQAQLLKHGSQELIQPLEKLILLIRKGKKKPNEQRTGIICPLLNKGDPTQCVNYTV